MCDLESASVMPGMLMGCRLSMVACVALIWATAVAAPAAQATAAHVWSLEATPNPEGSTDSVLSGVSCSSQARCTAVGYFKRTSGAGVPLAERWADSRWSIQALPEPAKTAAGLLFAVSCPSRSDCIAVGDVTRRGGLTVPLTERWNGTKWVDQQAPLPAGHGRVSYLGGVSCPSPGYCIAVGYSGNSDGTTGSPLAERWNGANWVVVRARRRAAAPVSFLSGVSCTSATSCTAVGFLIDASHEGKPLAEHWNGTVWRIQRTPTPPAAVYLQLLGVTCTQQGPCIAAGYFAIDTGIDVMLAERSSGTDWSLQNTSYPDGARGVEFTGVSCASPSDCTATGFLEDAAGTNQPLAEGWNGTRWAIEPTPSPARARSASLAGVSCSATGACTAVGSYVDHGGSEVTLAERYS
jgi:hypothetical protein